MISIHIPIGGKAPDLGKELASARNIQDRVVKNQTLAGLNKISQYL